MELIFNNQISIFEDIFYKYLTPKQCIKYYSSNNFLYNIYLKNNKFENNYFNPKSYQELHDAVNEWYINKKEAIIRYGNIEYWNTKNIEYMNCLFKDKLRFNDNISDWNTSNVTNMGCMFSNCYNFNQDISNWNINNIKYMHYMFYCASEFNQNLNNWDINNVKVMSYIFYNCNKFDKLNCKDWDLSNLKDFNKYAIFSNLKN